MKLTYFQRIFSASAFNSFLNQQKIVFQAEISNGWNPRLFEGGDFQEGGKLA